MRHPPFKEHSGEPSVDRGVPGPIPGSRAGWRAEPREPSGSFQNIRDTLLSTNSQGFVQSISVFLRQSRNQSQNEPLSVSGRCCNHLSDESITNDSYSLWRVKCIVLVREVYE